MNTVLQRKKGEAERGYRVRHRDGERADEGGDSFSGETDLARCPHLSSHDHIS